MSWLNSLRQWLPLALLAAVGLYVNHLERAAYDGGYAVAKAEGKTALEQLQREYSEADAKQARQAEADAKASAKREAAEAARADKLAADLAKQQRDNRKKTDHLVGEIARVNDLYRDALDAQPKPVPACVLTRGWVRVYDEATGARMPAPADPAGAAAPTGEAAAAEQLVSGLDQRAVLAHHVRYAEQCRNTAAQLDALINVLERH